MKIKATDTKFNKDTTININKGYIVETVKESKTNKWVRLLNTLCKIKTLERVYEEESFLKRVYLLNNEYTIKINPFQTFILLYQIRKNWLQKEENIRYLIKILFLIIGVCISIIGVIINI
jgi:hypothetical protein